MSPSPPAETTRWRLIALLYAAGLLAALQYAKVAYMLPGLVARTPMGPLQQAALLSVIGVVGALAGTFAGALCQAVGLRRTLAWGLVVAIPGALLPLVVASYPLLLLGRVIESVAHMAIVVSVPTLMLVGCASADRPRVMALWSSYFTVTFILAALLAPWLLQAAGWQAFAALHALLLALMLVVYLRATAGAGLPDKARPPSLRAVLHAQWRMLGQGRLLIIPATFLGYTLLFVALVSALPGVLADTPQSRFQLAFALPCASLTGTFIALTALGRGVAGHHLVRIAATGLAVAGVVLMFLPAAGHAALGVALASFVLLGMLPAGTVSSIPALFRPGDPDIALVNGGLVQFGNLGNFVGAPILATSMLLLGWMGVGLYIVVGALLTAVCLVFLRRFASKPAPA